MIVTLAPGIEAASGTLCNSPNGDRIIFTTRKSLTNMKNQYIQSDKVTMYNVQRFCAAGIFNIFFKKIPERLHICKICCTFVPAKK